MSDCNPPRLLRKYLSTFTPLVSSERIDPPALGGVVLQYCASDEPGKRRASALPVTSSIVGPRSRRDTSAVTCRPAGIRDGSDITKGTSSSSRYRLLPCSTSPCSPNCSP